ncbi:MAG: hypothetical protein RIE53_04970 [Rhodothermales bacterium]
MEGIVPVAVWLVIAVTGLSLLAIGVFGIRSLVQGKVNPTTIVLTMIPILLLGVLGFVMDSWAEAAVMACLLSIVLTSLALLASGLRGLFS